MNVLSLEFAGFVVIALCAYYAIQYAFSFVLPAKWLRLAENLFLLAASYYFYYQFESSYYFSIYLVSLTLADFLLGIWLHNSARKKPILWLGIALNVGCLLWFLIGSPYIKAAPDISFETKKDLFHILIVPIGISYYTLNGISYLIDISLKVAKPTYNPIDFALYLAWFPKLTAGPLERARKFLPLLAEKRTVDNAALASSLTLILVGLFRASILGGTLALLLPGRPLDDPASFGNLNLVWAMLTYMFYLYNQFAGYTDIVRGVSGLFGIPLSRNFNSPFFSKDISDFWQRWHISLSSWLRDYVYMPLSRAFLRRNPKRTNIPNLLIPPLVTMLISGLWHGNKPEQPMWGFTNFLIWGFIMGALNVFENVRMLSKPAVAAKSLPAWRQILSTLGLAAMMLVATAPFIMMWGQMLAYYRQLALGWEWQSIDLRPIIVPVLSLAVDWFQHKSGDEVVFLKWPTWLQVILIVLILVGAMVIQQLQSAPPMFVYP
jgi:D-alanyl-lipoteichoic acid acyltransferase DltB (MBOAT superfamily)